MWVRTPVLAALLAAAITVPGGLDVVSRAHAAPSWAVAPHARSALETRVQARVMPLREVIDIVRGRFGGELINARLEDSGDRPFYTLRWRMPNNDVVDIRVDAVSGQVYR